MMIHATPALAPAPAGLLASCGGGQAAARSGTFTGPQRRMSEAPRFGNST